MVSAGFFMWVIGKLIRVRRQAVVSGAEQMLGATGYALDGFEANGRVWVHSESWKARSHKPVLKGGSIRVVSIEGLTLDVEPVERKFPDHR